MDATSLYDLSPALRLMGMGLMVAAGPLAWLWLRHSGAGPARRLQALTLLTLFLTFDLVLFGAFTRLTDSGLGCPDWPGCYGKASPVGARDHIAAAQAAMPTGPVTHGKAWVEMIHRYLATGVGVLIVVLAVATWVLWRRQRAGTGPRGFIVHPAWPSVTLLWVCAQGAFGALTVTMKLFPAIVTLHLLGGVGLLVLLVVQAESYRQSAGAVRQPLGAGLRGLLWLTTAMVAVQIALGGWVSTNYAVLVCNTFPMCQGSWWPEMDFAQGFELWRPLGRSADGLQLEFHALTAIHYTHRLFAYAVFVALGVLAWQLQRAGRLAPQRRWLIALAALQLVTGLSNVVLDWPLLAAVLHTGGAAALMTVLAWALCASRAATEENAKTIAANAIPASAAGLKA
ncbi:COX15/CtaA family protein [Ottowia sp.]|uniref:COX15/CtaA family protein n=1 Tax=Ottowia sp. TaxID=1898956 RepID=UPI002CFEC2E3|nr:COX15/CtaA family protein [Ottowia sp.]HOB67324.1 COX15/CtaA family protein [Ottowia sp.]HPZ55950.1 COX15/CtaA family protein [Ottowia sp.]HQD48119.1 COX15/CtaA family protein [Ottowia sp.]